MMIIVVINGRRLRDAPRAIRLSRYEGGKIAALFGGTLRLGG